MCCSAGMATGGKLNDAFMTFEKAVQTKPGILVELALFFSICLSPLPPGIIIPLFVCLAIFSLKTRKQTRKGLGFSFADFSLRKICWGLALTIVYLLSFHFLINPALSGWFPDADLRALGMVKKDIGRLLFYLLVTWTVAAFGEELIFRGYLINRFTDLLGNTLPAKLCTVFLSSVPFAFAHAYQGKHGMITAGVFGVFQSIVYLTDNKRLTIPVVIHGSFDTVGFIELFV